MLLLSPHADRHAGDRLLFTPHMLVRKNCVMDYGYIRRGLTQGNEFDRMVDLGGYSRPSLIFLNFDQGLTPRPKSESVHNTLDSREPAGVTNWPVTTVGYATTTLNNLPKDATNAHQTIQHRYNERV